MIARAIGEINGMKDDIHAFWLGAGQVERELEERAREMRYWLSTVK